MFSRCHRTRRIFVDATVKKRSGGTQRWNAFSLMLSRVSRVENDESCSASYSRSCGQVVGVSGSLSFSFFFSWWSKIFKSLDCRTYRLRNMWMIFNEILILLYFERIGLVSLFLCHVENKRKSSFDFSKLKKLIYPQFFEYIIILVKW